MRSITPIKLIVLGYSLVFIDKFSSASPLKTRSNYGLKDSHPVPAGWHKVERAWSEEHIHLKIGLRHGQFDELERHLYEGTAIS
jgi:hypothetical protein